MISVEQVSLPVPLRFRRGSLRQDEKASVRSALALIDLMDSIVPITGATILDYGCGVKIAQGLVQLGCPQKRYVGLDVNEDSIGFLRDNCPGSHFDFHFIDFLNRRYNPKGKPMDEVAALPVSGEFDLQVMFSVITHMIPQDTHCALSLLRTCAHADTRLLFSAFVDETQASDFADLVPDKPLLKASYRKGFMEELIVQSGWRIISHHKAIPGVIQGHYTCRPG